MFFSRSKSFDPATDIPSLAGKVIIVTGGNTGLGLETCLQLAGHDPAHIYLAARTASKAESAIAQVKKAHPTASISHVSLDLSSLPSVASAAQTILAASDRLDLLINNAGVMALPAGLTEQGYEIQFGTNHVGHALLTHLLLPRLQETAARADADVRIVNLSSEGHRMPPRNGIAFDELHSDMAGWLTWKRYGQSKLANILYAKQLAKRYPAIKTVALHPGVIKTDLYASSSSSSVLLKYGFTLANSLFMISVADGTKNQLWAATAPAAEVESGAYYTPVGLKTAGTALARDEPLAERLWEWTAAEIKKQGY